MATKIKTNPEDLVPNGNINNEMQQELLNAKEALNSENKTNTKKKTSSKTNTKKNKSLTTEEIMFQKTDGKPAIDPKYGPSTTNDIISGMKAKFNDVISAMTIDLNNITLSDDMNVMEQHQNLDIVFHSKPTFEVVLCQSCYTAYMEALLYSDIESIIESTGDNYSVTLKTYQTIHEKMQATTIGSFNFDTFLKCTSFFDLSSLYYALQMQTFPGTSKFDFKCIHCEHKFSRDIPNDSLVFSRDDNIFERLDDVRNEATSPEYVIQNSLVSKYQRICLNNSKTIVDIKIPTLKDQLDLLRVNSTNKNKLLSDNDIATLLFIKGVYVISVPETLAKGKPYYYPIIGPSAITNIIKQLSVADSRQLSKAIEEWTDKYKVEYRIPSFKCPKCGKELGKMPVDMESLVFRLMLEQ